MVAARSSKWHGLPARVVLGKIWGGSPRHIFMVAALVAFITGCKTDNRDNLIHYTGPTQTLEEVIRSVNENNRAIPTLYAKHYFEGTIVDPETKKSEFVNTSGDLMVRKPREFWMRGKKDPGIDIFDIGSTADIFWATVFVGPKKQWWGHYRNIDKPCSKAMPIRPDLIGEVLGIGDINTNLLDSPAPTMRFNNDLDVYMLVWSVKGSANWYAEKEIWYDRATLLPRKVLIFDKNGRIQLRADVSLHQSVSVEGKPKEQWPKVATYYDLFFPETKSRMTIRLSEMALVTKKGHPKEGTIMFRESSDVTSVQIDEDCGK